MAVNTQYVDINRTKVPTTESKKKFIPASPLSVVEHIIETVDDSSGNNNVVHNIPLLDPFTMAKLIKDKSYVIKQEDTNTVARGFFVDI